MRKLMASEERKSFWSTLGAPASRAALVTLLACACSPAKQEVGVDMATGEAPVLLCDASEREFYVVDAIRRKLDYYPELADYAGLREVKTCEDARAFRVAYYEFSALYPDFDRDQPAGEIPEVDEIGAPEPGEDPELEVSKLMGGATPGVAFPNSPFVRLTELREPGQQICSGALIAKRWILTAAHCLGLTDLTTPVPLVDRRHRHLVGYGRFAVEWANAAGDVVAGDTDPTSVKIRARSLDMLQLPHPNFMGSEFPDDIALIYLNNDAYDRMLPARVDQGAAMRLSVRPVQVNGTPGLPVTNPAERVFAAGFGDPVVTHLRAASVFPSQIPSIRGARTFHAQLANHPPPEGTFPTPVGTQPALCHGDSGGPVWRVNEVQGVTLPVPIVVGSFIGTTPGTTVCPPPLGSFQIWTDISEYTKSSGFGTCGTDPRKPGCFIEAHIARWVGKNFVCTPGRLRGGTDDDFVQCWTQQCQTEICGADNFCAHTVRGGTCPQCPNRTCGCIFGQCEPKAR